MDLNTPNGAPPLEPSLIQDRNNVLTNASWGSKNHRPAISQVSLAEHGDLRERYGRSVILSARIIFKLI